MLLRTTSVSVLIVGAVVGIGLLGCDRKPEPSGDTTGQGPTAPPVPTPVASAGDAGTGWVRSDEDCRAARACKEFGACSYRDGRCAASSDEDCAKSQWCQRVGQCKAHDGRCVVGGETDADCQRAHGASGRNPCKTAGRCTARDGVCVAALDEDCHKSRVCIQSAACTAKDGRCVIATEEDCKRSALCKQQGRCKLKTMRGRATCVREEKPADDHGRGPEHGHQH